MIQNHEKARVIAEVRHDIERNRIPKGVTPAEFFGALVRRAIDEVVSLRPGRWAVSQLDKTEKTYIGTRSEILVRDALDAGFGTTADIVLAGHDVDLKWSQSLKWMIGPENIGTVCLGLGTNAAQTTFSVGLFVPYPELIGKQNRDKKYSVVKEFLESHVTWIVRESPLPRNFVADLPEHVRADIMGRSSAQSRMRRLAELQPNIPIPRAALQFVSFNKDDFMRRIRDDKGAPLGEMRALSWKYRKEEIRRLGIDCPRDHFVFADRRVLEEGD